MRLKCKKTVTITSSFSVYYNMVCPKCRSALAPGAKFCSNCGTPLQVFQAPMVQPPQMGQPMPRPAPTQMPVGQPPNRQGQIPNTMGGAPQQPHYAPYINTSGRKRVHWPAIVATVVVLAILAALGKVGYGLWLSAKQKSSPLSVKGATGGPLLSVDAQVPDADLKVLASRKQMPDDIYAWLQHLQRCDMLKRDLTQRQDIELASLIPQLKGAGGLTSAADVDKMTDPDSNFTGPPGADLINKEIEKISTQWTQLKARFDKMPPPAECQPIADAYDAGLSDTMESVGSISSIMNGINVNDPNLRSNIDASTKSLKGIGKDNAQGIDNMFAQTDTLVQNICNKYDVTKWFSIDVSGGNQDAFSSFGL